MHSSEYSSKKEATGGEQASRGPYVVLCIQKSASIIALKLGSGPNLPLPHRRQAVHVLHAILDLLKVFVLHACVCVCAKVFSLSAGQLVSQRVCLETILIGTTALAVPQ